MNFLTARVDLIQRLLGLAALGTLLIGLGLVFTAPVDFQQGDSVRILYAHVSSAKMALLCYVALTICAIGVLWKKSEGADAAMEALAVVGACFTAVTLVTGAIWGKPMWGTWWAWDARLTSMLVLLIIYVGLVALRSSLDNPQKAAKATAVLAIIGAVDLPIIHFSVVWWRTLHQPAMFKGNGMITMAPEMRLPLAVMAIAFILMGAYMTLIKTRAIRAQRRLDALEDEALALEAESDHA
ncbi:heme ABC transporter permease CcmC [Magnetofaba australis]|uniref:Heme exporter protein C n=1 Tax=Magnetofaba australis IT-1 TaxID=1434232 RepID=A0A1Y2K0D1_9PROT|nr:heme ABC transporter permease CcmC [Magnetofaba australis]OSM01478.1 putative heme exporter protein CcmC [Magnetofaba australis IT-1]